LLHAAKSIRFDSCTFTKLGGAGIDVEHGSQDNVISGCHLHDISGSGIQIGDVLQQDHHPDDKRLIVKNNRVVNSYVHHVGAEYEDSIGVFAGYTDGTVIAHNEISHLPYTGVSVGWGWGNPDAGGRERTKPENVYDTPTACRNNRIEYNHIHHVMQRRDDGGGVYTLSNQPGTIIRGNHIHDNGLPGSWGPGGIYLDEGSGFIEVTGNVVSNVHCHLLLNSRSEDRVATCKVHDNFFDVVPQMLKPGKVGKALAGSWLDVDHSPALEPARMTVEAWVYLDAYPQSPDNRRWLVSKNAHEQARGHYALVIAGRAARAYLNIGGGQKNFHQTDGKTDMLTLRKWHHLAMTYDGSVLRLYLDGALAGSKAVNEERIAGNGAVSIGKRGDGHRYFTEGRIDEVRIYRRVLSADEIKAHFVAPAAVPPHDKALVKHWGFEDDEGSATQKKLQRIVAKAGLEPEHRKMLLMQRR